MVPLPRAARAVLGAALLLRLAAAAHYYRVPLSPGGDDRQYAEIAENLAEGRGYLWGGAPTAYRAPLYPLFLAGLRRLGLRSEGAARAAQAFVSAATVWLAYQLGAAAAGPAAGLAAMALTAFDPAQILLPTSLYSECLFGALVLLAAWALARYRRDADDAAALTLGAAVGLSALCRSTLLLVPLFAAAATPAPPRARARHAVLALLSCGLVLAPWIARNALRFHRFIPAESGVVGPIVYYGSEGRVRAPEREDSLEPIKTLVRTRPHVDWDGVALRLALANVRARPGRYAFSVAARVWNLWTDSYLCYLVFYHPAHAATMAAGRHWDELTWACLAAFAVVFILALLAVPAAASRPALWAVLVLAAYANVYALGTVFARFNAPFQPLLYVAAGVAWGRIAVKRP